MIASSPVFYKTLTAILSSFSRVRSTFWWGEWECTNYASMRCKNRNTRVQRVCLSNGQSGPFPVEADACSTVANLAIRSPFDFAAPLVCHCGVVTMEAAVIMTTLLGMVNKTPLSFYEHSRSMISICVVPSSRCACEVEPLLRGIFSSLIVRARLICGVNF